MRRKKLLAAHWRDPVAKKRTVGWLLCRCCSGALLFAMVGDADVLHVVIPGGHYTTVPRVCLDKYCEHIGIAAGSTAQDNFLRAVDHCEPQARQYKVSRGYRRPANVMVLQKVNRLLDPDAGRRLEFVSGEASNNNREGDSRGPWCTPSH